MMRLIMLCPVFELCTLPTLPFDDDERSMSSHSFVNQFDKMDRTKPHGNHKDIVCGAPFDATEVLQELARLRKSPVEIVQNKQEDAHELLCLLLSEIHEEICQILTQATNNRSGKI
jgi:hypothetical protein